MPSQSSATKARKSTPDAIALLTADHRRVSALFKQFEASDDSAAKVEIARTICDELTVHATVEEEIFYPRAVAELREDDKDLVWEATVEHGTLEGLIAVIQAASPDDVMYDAHVTVLKEYVEHHVEEEEKAMFPKVKKTGIDLIAMGEELQARKEEIQAQGPGAPSSKKAAAPMRNMRAAA